MVSAFKTAMKNGLKHVKKYFGVCQNGLLNMLDALFDVVFNSKHFSSNEHFSKMLLKPTKCREIDRAAILFSI